MRADEAAQNPKADRIKGAASARDARARARTHARTHRQHWYRPRRRSPQCSHRHVQRRRPRQASRASAWMGAPAYRCLLKNCETRQGSWRSLPAAARALTLPASGARDRRSSAGRPVCASLWRFFGSRFYGAPRAAPAVWELLGAARFVAGSIAEGQRTRLACLSLSAGRHSPTQPAEGPGASSGDGCLMRHARCLATPNRPVHDAYSTRPAGDAGANPGTAEVLRNVQSFLTIAEPSEKTIQ